MDEDGYIHLQDEHLSLRFTDSLSQILVQFQAVKWIPPAIQYSPSCVGLGLRWFGFLIRWFGKAHATWRVPSFGEIMDYSTTKLLTHE
jgi:hypothetical protein